LKIFIDHGSKKPSFRELVTKLNEIQIGLRQSLEELQGNIEIMESKLELSNELMNLHRDVETRAEVLETDVKHLREDLKFIKDLLGTSSETKKQAKIQKDE
jgi:hypothetical protein